MDLSPLEERLGYTFKDKKLLEAALDWEKGSRYHYSPNSKKLEHLGDKLIGLIVSEELAADLPNYAPIPKLASYLVSNAMLSKIADSLGIAEYVVREKGNHPRKTFLADAFEAITYAVYLDSGRSIEVARKFVRAHILPKTNLALAESGIPNQIKQIKRAFGAATQPRPRRLTPEAMLASLILDLHRAEPEYKLQPFLEKGNQCVIGVYVKGDLLATGAGHAISKAKTNAIQAALKKLREQQKALEGWQRSS